MKEANFMTVISVLILVFLCITIRIIYAAKSGRESKFVKYGIIVVVIVFLLYIGFSESDMVHNGNISITEKRMRVKFDEADRSYTNSMKLNASKKLDIKAKCEEGKLLLRVYQKQNEYTYDISEWDKTLELDDFEEGYINVHLENEDARNVNVEIKCVD